ncbi:hypothetical protein T09_8265 [Trichinella sp. T9]|nr:hypothetical protein T09_8265 [Trichinella sp. T9]
MGPQCLINPQYVMLKMNYASLPPDSLYSVGLHLAAVGFDRQTVIAQIATFFRPFREQDWTIEVGAVSTRA